MSYRAQDNDPLHRDRVTDLITHLAANVSVATIDEEPERAAAYQRLLNTAQALKKRATELENHQIYAVPKLTRVTVIGPDGIVFEDYQVFADGAEVTIQDEGRTLKVWPRRD